jgi:hypothetical protein
VATLVAVRALAAAGVAIELDVPLVAARLQDLAAIVALFARAVPQLRALRVRVPRYPVPRALAPPPIADVGPRLEAALAACAIHGVAAPIDVTAAIPLCALTAAPRAQAAVRFDPRRATLVSGCVQPSCVRDLRGRAQCRAPGVAAAYGDAADVRPLATRPAALYAQRTTPLRVWDEPRPRRGPRQASLLVLRPTVHCNQDCGFCSANESTRNVWAEPALMIRAIARAARRGVRAGVVLRRRADAGPRAAELRRRRTPAPASPRSSWSPTACCSISRPGSTPWSTPA